MMNYRYVNNVGYSKIYPMSERDDDGFCHYCGRKPSITVSLEWDHVPALNVKIPEQLQNTIRKTLVRACRECNGLASDVPHLDYYSRHLWLKVTYLRKYKRLLENEGAINNDTENLSDYLRAVINNENYKYEDILRMIGFGLTSLNEIETPILDIKTKSGKRLRNILTGYLFGVPNLDEDEKEDSDDEVVDVECCSFPDFIEFLLEHLTDVCTVIDKTSYNKYRREKGYLFVNEKLPNNPSKYYEIRWENIQNVIKMVISSTKKKQRVTPYYIEDLRYEFSENLDFVSFLEFVDILALEQTPIITNEDYQRWFEQNSTRAKNLELPPEPAIYYSINWEEIAEKVYDVRSSFEKEQIT